jgi:predicted enzyme related to lactoylglutathione lyase
MQPGQIGWIDLTVEDAPRLRDFYAEVAGWGFEEHSMGDYSDFVMKAGDAAVGGVCHARGSNEGQPAGWMIYIVVEDLERSLEACTARGGDVRVPVRTMGGEGRFAVIEDPAGSVCALYQAS